MKVSEHHIEQTCTQFLELDGWRCIKTDPVSDRSTVQDIRRAVHKNAILQPYIGAIELILSKCVRGKGFGEIGMADCLYVRYGTAARVWPQFPAETMPLPNPVRAAADLMWIEWKSLKGKAKPHQLQWIKAERARGALVFLAGVDFPASIEGFGAWYRGSGLQRNESLRLAA